MNWDNLDKETYMEDYWDYIEDYDSGDIDFTRYDDRRKDDWLHDMWCDSVIPNEEDDW